MKNALSFLILCLLSFSTFASIRTVNINGGAQYTSLNTALQFAASGDTILVSGAAQTYFFSYGTGSNLVLTIIGPGFNPVTPSLETAKVSGNFNTSSGPITWIGIDFLTDYNAAPGGGSDKQNFYRCFFRGNLINAASGSILEGNIFANNGICYTFNFNSANIIVQNNIFYGTVRNYLGSGTGGTNNIFRNNIFFSSTPVLFDPTPGIVSSTVFNNNIFYGYSSFSAGVYNNNASTNCGGSCPPFPTSGSGNKVGVAPLWVAGPASTSAYNYVTDNFDLQATSQLIGAGADGLNIGITGGNGYFEKRGVPGIPQIRTLQLVGSSSVAPGGTLQVNISSTIRQ